MITCDKCKQNIKINDFTELNGSYMAYSYLDKEKNEKHLCRECVKELFDIDKKLYNLMLGLQMQNIDDLMKKANANDYLKLGLAYYMSVLLKIEKEMK